MSALKFIHSGRGHFFSSFGRFFCPSQVIIQGWKVGQENRPLVPQSSDNSGLESGTREPSPCPREASFAPRQTLPVAECEGRVLAESALSCPPCVPIAVCGERIDRDVIERLRFYGIRECAVVR